MLSVQSLSLTQFKNYAHKSFEFEDRIIGIVGDNGAGKTNLLDAIHYLCFTRSYFLRSDEPNVQHGQHGFRIEGEIMRLDQQEKAVCIFRENGKKEFSINNVGYEKFSHHIGHYPCVVIAPDDAQLITGTSAERRKFIDSLLSQLDEHYLQELIRYQRILQQRNSQLKTDAENNTRDESLMDVLDTQLVQAGNYIFDKRKEFLLGFLPEAGQLYQFIAGAEEDIKLYYESELLETDFATLLKQNRQKDVMLMRTSAGTHRDDIELSLLGQPFRQLASQGQRKSLLFALKLAEMDAIRKEKKFSPILLLDDVFEKLDENRIGHLLQKVCLDNHGQVFITDTHPDRLRSHLDSINISFQLITL
jgi:DNA replication and repair protein RecF